MTRADLLVPLAGPGLALYVNAPATLNCFAFSTRDTGANWSTDLVSQDTGEAGGRHVNNEKLSPDPEPGLSVPGCR